MDFDKFENLNYQEKVRFNSVFSYPEIQDELKAGFKRKKLNSLIIITQVIIGISLFVYMYVQSGNLKASIISTSFFSTVLFLFSIPMMKKVGLNNILINIIRKNLGTKVKFSNKSTYFNESISKLHKKTGLIKEYAGIEYSMEGIKNSMKLIRKNDDFKVNIAEIEYEDGKNMYYKIIIKIESENVLIDNKINIIQRVNTLYRVGKLILFYFIGGLLSLLSFILVGLVFIDFNFYLSSLEMLFVIFAFTFPGGCLGVWSNFKNQLANPDLVKFNHPKINKIYDIYCKEKTNVYKIFNYKTINTILKYGNILDKKFNIYIFGNEIYIEFDIHNNYLNFSFLTNPFNEKNYVDKYLKVKNITSFTEELLQSIGNINIKNTH